MREHRYLYSITGLIPFLFLAVNSCDKVPTDTGEPIADCKYGFINNQVISTFDFDLDMIPYCIDCEDEEGKKGTYNIIIERPKDKFNDSVPLRPHIMQVHGYGPNSNEPKDPYAALMLIPMRQHLVRYGFSISTLEYRQDIKGFNFCSTPEMEVIRTHYRAMQDLRAAIDKLYENPEAYGIDIENLYLMGNSQGAITILNAILAENEDEWLSTLPERFHGIKDELGSWAPKRKIKGIITVAGALYDTSLLNANDNIPLFMAHGTCDNQVPYKTDTFLQCDTDVLVQGSYEVACRADELGKPFSLYSYTNVGHDYNDQVLNPLYENVRKWIIEQTICGNPTQEEFTLTGNLTSCAETSTSLNDCGN